MNYEQIFYCVFSIFSVTSLQFDLENFKIALNYTKLYYRIKFQVGVNNEEKEKERETGK